MIQGILSGGSWFALFLAVHILIFHLRHVKRCFAVIMRVYLLSLTGHAATIFWLNNGIHRPGPGLASFFYGLVIAGCLFILYMPFYYNVVNSLSIQTLILLSEAPGDSLPVPELQERFAGSSIVEGRLNAMAANGYLTEDRGTYCLTHQGRAMARLFGTIKDFWKMGAGG